MTSRTSNILKALTQEFISHGEPVSSGHLYESYDFGIKPAMIRAELADLAERGYLRQPYPSAGRVPTDKAYRFFAGQFIEQAPSPPKRTLSEQYDVREKEEWQGLLRDLARELGAVNVAAHREGEFFFKEGLADLISRLEWESRDALERVVRDFEAINEEMMGALPEVEGVSVFVGRQSPIMRSNSLAVIAGEYRRGDRTGSVMLMMVGPKRMDYAQAILAMRELLGQ